MSKINIRKATEADFHSIWEIYQEIITARDTYSNYENTTKEDAHTKWMDEETHTYVATMDNTVVAAYLLKANWLGYGDHVANASFIVSSKHRGNGIGKLLGQHALATSRTLKFEAIQFNYVISSNLPAVELWKSLGFNIIGVVPKGYRNSNDERIDVYIMHRFL